jgi:hypothetical protein
MPQKGYKSITVPKNQWEAVKQLVKAYPQVAGRSISEFYIIAATDRLKELYALLKFIPDAATE